MSKEQKSNREDKKKPAIVFQINNFHATTASITL
jgi:hypothetical protein